MTTSLREELRRTADGAPDRTPDADMLWSGARRANRRSTVVAALVVVAAVLFGGMLVRAAVVPDGPQPADHPDQLGFPDDLYDIPGRTVTTDEAGPLGPLALIGLAQHKGFWPWSASQEMAYGISADSGEYRFLSLPGSAFGSDISAAGPALSPDGRRVAYAYATDGSDALEAEGIAVFDSSTAKVSTFTPPSDLGWGITWFAWSPDGSELAAGMMPRGEAEGNYTNDGALLVNYRVASDRFSSTPDQGRLTGTHLPITWKPAGSDSPTALVRADDNLALFDPHSGERRAQYTWPRPVNLQSAIVWLGDGDTFAVINDDCRNTCRASDRMLVRGFLRGGIVNKVDLTTIAPAIGQAFYLLGYGGKDPTSPLIGLTTSDSSGSESTVQQMVSVDASGQSEWRLSSSELGAVSVDAGAVPLATGPSAAHVEPPPPALGWLALIWWAVILGSLVLICGRCYLFGSSLTSAWRQDPESMMLLVPALTTVAYLALLQVGPGREGFDLDIGPVSVVVASLLAWRVTRGGRIAWSVLIALTAAAGVGASTWLFSEPSLAQLLVVGAAAVQLAALLSPAVRSATERRREPATAEEPVVSSSSDEPSSPGRRNPPEYGG